MDENNSSKNSGIVNGKILPRPVASVHEFYLTGEISEASNYIEWFDSMRHANETDVIKIYINSYGGDLFTAIQFMRVMADSPATIVASVEGMCMSAATVVFLCADAYEVTPHSVFMFHNYSGGTIGKGGEMIDQLLHERKWSENLMNAIYKDFMHANEIKAMLDNKDIWMDGEEVVKRLNMRMERRKKEEARVMKEELKAETPKVRRTRRAKEE